MFKDTMLQPGYPQDISMFGNGMPEQSIETAVWWEDVAKTYFFKGDRYVHRTSVSGCVSVRAFGRVCVRVCVTVCFLLPMLSIYLRAGIGDTMKKREQWILVIPNPSQSGRVYRILLRERLWIRPMV